MRHAITFAKKHKKKIIIMGKSNINNINDQLYENKFYYDVIKNSNLKIHFNDKEKFENYKTIIKSKVIIGCMSSLLREAFAFKKKVFCCKYIPGTVFPSNGICTLKNKSYLKFETQLKTILKISYKDYLAQIDGKENLYNKKN